MAGVVIECLDYDEFIRRCDGKATLFYLDPPYCGSENDYGKEVFSRGDFDAMANLLAGIKGHFLMSINDVPDVREMFDRFRLTSVATTYTVGKQNDSSGSRSEPLISNFKVDLKSN